jgi:hypothetical protein
VRAAWHRTSSIAFTRQEIKVKQAKRETFVFQDWMLYTIQTVFIISSCRVAAFRRHLINKEESALCLRKGETTQRAQNMNFNVAFLIMFS